MRFSMLLLTILLAAPAAPAAGQADHPDSARIVTADIPRFWRAWDRFPTAATRQDSVRALFEEYYLEASPGLEAFIRARIASVYDLLAVIQTMPRYYASARASSLRIAEFEPEIRRAFHALDSLHPDAVFPDTYFLIGRTNSGGTVARTGLLIGAEMYGRTAETPDDELTDWLRTVLKPVDAIPHIVAHELIHYQQHYPEERRPTLLAQSIREGSADFLAELISGRHINEHVHAWADPRAPELWAEFRDRMLGTDYAGWLYGGNDQTDRPNDLGYWMGYRIVAAYYARAGDKRQAIRDILTIADFEAFLERSGAGAELEAPQGDRGRRD